MNKEKIFKISCEYSIKNLSSDLLGNSFRILMSKKGSLKSFNDLWYEGIGDFFLLFYDNQTRTHFSYHFFPKGTESLGGNMFGFVINKKEALGRYDELGYSISVSGDWEDSEIIRISSYGEKSRQVITEAYNLEMWYKRNPDGIPKELIVDKKTIDFIAIELTNGKWIYVCSGGEGYFSVYFNKGENPDAFINEMLYAENGSNVELLEVIE